MVNRVELEPWRWWMSLAISLLHSMHRSLVVARGRRCAPHFPATRAADCWSCSQLRSHANKSCAAAKRLGMLIVDVLACSVSGGGLQIVLDHHELHGSSTRYLVVKAPAVLSTFVLCVGLMPV